MTRRGNHNRETVGNGVFQKGCDRGIVGKVHDTVDLNRAVDTVKGGIARNAPDLLTCVQIHTADDVGIAEALLGNAKRLAADAAADAVKQNIHVSLLLAQTFRPC